MHTGLYFNGGPTKETVTELRIALEMVLNSPNAEAVKIAAIDMLASVCPTQTTISNCHITGDTINNHPEQPA